MNQFFPFLQWVATYKKSYFTKDLMAGLTVGIVLVPQAMAYAMIAGLPPVYGLYAAFLPVLTYVFLGTSRKIGVGPVAMDSLLVAAGLGTLSITGPEHYIAMVAVLAFLVGAIQFLLGLMRMGFLVNFLSKPVISGFTSGAAIIIMLSQLKHLFGTGSANNSSTFHILVMDTFNYLSEINTYTLLVGGIGILLIVVFRKWNARIPGILIVTVLATVAAYLLKLGDYGVALVGTVPSGLPSFVIPDLKWNSIEQLWPIALALALVGYLEAISIGKSLEVKSGEETIDPNQELLALGSSNILGSFFQAYPVTASFSRSAINHESGAKTNLAALFSVVLVVLTLLFLTPVFEFLPNAVLASIIMVSVFKLIDFSYAKRLWQYRRDEFVVLLITFLSTLFLGIKEGIFVGMLSSLLLMVYRTSKPHFAVLGKVRNTEYYKNLKRFGDEVTDRPDLLIMRFDAQLYFGNATFFKTELMKEVAKKGEALKGVILNAEAINYIDSTAADMLTKTIREIHEMDLQFYIAGAIGPTRDIIFSSGIIKELHKEYLFVKTNEAVAFFDDPRAVSEVSSRVAYENRCKKDTATS
ncbi:SulP family inorganic anion transporter [Maribacter chungangensis]|uniref:SulP family inorganic anion transporter n=1 Tax=Maribacter chungangensis TaxID=1069117 RepID=A0ABW3B0U4_9FLAO